MALNRNATLKLPPKTKTEVFRSGL
ncbi:hypothetical protein [Leptospira kirschneri]